MYASWSGATSTSRSPSGWPSAYAASMKSVPTPDRDSSASSSMPVLPFSVSTSRQPALESVLAMRSAGKCGSMGKYEPPALRIASTAVIQSRLRSVTTPTTPSRVSPRASRARATSLARALSSPYVSCLEPCTAAMALGRARAWCSKTSWARRSGSLRLGPASIVVTRSLMSHFPRRVAGPTRACRNILSLHKKGVGGEHCAVTHRHAVKDKCANPDRAASANRRSVAFESAVLLRVALDLAPVIEDRLIPDGGERRLGDVRAVVEDPPADPNTHQLPEQVLERRAIESVQVVNRMHLPNALRTPEIGMVDGANGRPHWAQRYDATLHPDEVNSGRHDAERKEHGVHRVWKHIGTLERGQVEEGEQEDAYPPCEEENTDGLKIAAILCREAAAQRLPRPEMVESHVALNGSRNLETRSAQQADPFADLAVERNQHLGAEEDVVTRPAARGIGDVVAHEVVGPDRCAGHTERGARNLVIHQMQPVRDHRSGADRAQRWVRVPHFGAEIHPGLQDWRKTISKPLQEVDDVSAVTEQIREEFQAANPRNRPVRRVVEAVERIDGVRLDKRVQHARNSDRKQEADEREAEEEHE